MLFKSNFKHLLWLPFWLTTHVFAVDLEYIEDGKKGIEAFRQGDLITAMGLLERSAAGGYAPAQTTLGFILDGAEENSRAFELFQAAANSGYPEAMFRLGKMYAKGEGVDINQALAGDWIKKAASLQHVPAMRALAIALEHGTLGFVKNEIKSYHWYLKCDENGDSVCSRRLMVLFTNGGLGHAADKVKAAHFRDKIKFKPKEY